MPLPGRRILAPVDLIAAAAFSGAALALAFPPYSFAPLAFVALVPLLLGFLARRRTRRESFKAGFVFGFLYFLFLLWWVSRLVPWAHATFPWLLTPAMLLLVCYLALYPALFFLILVAIAGRSGPALLLGGPALWVLMEYARTQGVLGFPWGVVGYSLTYYPLLIQSASFFGVLGLSSLVILVNFSIALALARRGSARWVLLALAFFLPAADGFYGWVRLKGAEGTGREVSAAVMQPNVDLRIKWDPTYTDTIFAHIERLTSMVAGMEPDLIVFPETAAPAYVPLERSYLQRLSRAASSARAFLFIGFLDAGRETQDGRLDTYNSSGLFSPSGRLVGRYHKVHLLPFGEALPWGWRFGFLRRIDLGQANFQPGRPVPPLAADSLNLGPLICFESIFPALSRRYVALGADLLVNITNDGWFGSTPGPEQHAQMAILRAVENARTLVRAANTGVSMVVDPWGRVKSSLPVNQEGVLVERVELCRRSTFYTAHGDRPLLVLAEILSAAALVVSRRRRGLRT